MSIDVSQRVPATESLRSLSLEQLVTILLQQQQTINRLTQVVYQLKVGTGLQGDVQPTKTLLRPVGNLQSGDPLTLDEAELEFHCPPAISSNSTVNLDQGKAPTSSPLYVRHLVSVLVVDIRDFTILTRKLDERLLSEVMDTWFRCAGEIIRDHHSQVDKYIGDAVMAVWIHDCSRDAQAIHQDMIYILHALSSLHEMTTHLHHRYPLPFPLQIGAAINTGYAMVGNAGSGDRPDCTALGDTVNAAFRLESSTKQTGLDIALGETVYQHLLPLSRKSLPFKQQTVNLKGYDSPAVTYTGSFADLNTFLQICLSASPLLRQWM